MGTIRRLTSADYDVICQVIESRPYFQGKAVDQQFLTNTKELYVKNRLNLEKIAYFFGYFDDSGELIAFREAHATPVIGAFAMGVSYTKKGKADARWQGTNWPEALIELNHTLLDFLWDLGAHTIWVVGPATPPKAGRLVEAPGTKFADQSKFKREDDIPVKAGSLTGDPYLDNYVLMLYVPATDQVIMRFSVVDWKFKPPVDAPPPLDAPVFNGHPPMNMQFSNGVFTEPPK